MTLDPHSSPPEEVEQTLRNRRGVLDVETAGTIRDWVAQRVLSEPQRALEIASLLRNVAEQSDLPEVRASGWRCFGDASLYQGRFHDSRDAYERASEYARQAEAWGLLGQILVSRIGVLSNQGRAADAAALVSEAEELLEASDDRPYLARLHMSLGNAAFHRHQYQDAYERFSRADREFRALGATDGMTLGLRINLGVASYSALSRVEESRQIFLEVERDCARLELHHLEAQAKFNRAHLEMLWGNYRAAISLLETAESIFAREKAPELMAGTQLTRAEAFVDLGMPDEAVQLARRAGESYRGCELDLDATVADEVQARALRSEGRSTEARRILQGVRSFYERANLPVGVALTDLEIVRTIRAPGELGEAAQVATRALGALDSRGLIEPLARGRIVLAEVLRRSGRPDLAESSLEPSLDVANLLSTRARIDLWTVAGRISRDLGARFPALRRYRRAVAEVERERHLSPGAELKARATGTEADREFIDLLLESHDLKFESLFRLVESIQGRRWRRDDGHRESGAPEWSRRRAELASLVRQLQQREAEGIQSQTELDHEELLALRKQIGGLEAEILSGVRTAFFRSTPLSAGPHSPRGDRGSEVLRTALRPGQAVLEYFNTGERLVILSVRPEGSSFRVLDFPPEEIRILIRDWHMQLESFALLAHRGVPNLAFRRPAADHLLDQFSRLLLAPILPLLEDVQELIVIPHGILHQAPFECLRVDGRYIDERFRIRRLPSAELLTRPRPRGESEREVVIVAVENGPPGSESEGRAVAGKTGAALLLDPTSEEILTALEDSRTVHWTTHGVLRDDNPLFSHLATRDGGLFLADLRGRRLSADRVVLSACDTGKVVSARSDDVSGVAVAFLESGVRELVAGLWRLHDEATVQFMEAFYEATERLPESSAALALQSTYQATRVAWDHPFYWGGFAVYG